MSAYTDGPVYRARVAGGMGSGQQQNVGESRTAHFNDGAQMAVNPVTVTPGGGAYSQQYTNALGSQPPNPQAGAGSF